MNPDLDHSCCPSFLAGRQMCLCHPGHTAQGLPLPFLPTCSQHRITPIQGEGGQGPAGSHISESSWETCLVEAHPLREKYESNMGAAFDVVVAMKEHQPRSSSRDWPQVPQFFPSFLGARLHCHMPGVSKQAAAPSAEFLSLLG